MPTPKGKNMFRKAFDLIPTEVATDQPVLADMFTWNCFQVSKGNGDRFREFMSHCFHVDGGANYDMWKELNRFMLFDMFVVDDEVYKADSNVYITTPTALRMSAANVVKWIHMVERLQYYDVQFVSKENLCMYFTDIDSTHVGSLRSFLEAEGEMFVLKAFIMMNIAIGRHTYFRCGDKDKGRRGVSFWDNIDINPGYMRALEPFAMGPGYGPCIVDEVDITELPICLSDDQLLDISSRLFHKNLKSDTFELTQFERIPHKALCCAAFIFLGMPDHVGCLKRMIERLPKTQEPRLYWGSNNRAERSELDPAEFWAQCTDIVRKDPVFDRDLLCNLNYTILTDDNISDLYEQDKDIFYLYDALQGIFVIEGSHIDILEKYKTTLSEEMYTHVWRCCVSLGKMSLCFGTKWMREPIDLTNTESLRNTLQIHVTSETPNIMQTTPPAKRCKPNTETPDKRDIEALKKSQEDMKRDQNTFQKQISEKIDNLMELLNKPRG